MNDKKHNPALKHQNKYIRQQDKACQKAIEENKNIELQHDENFRVRTFLQALSVCLYASAYLGLPRVSGTVINSKPDIDITNANSSTTTSPITELPIGASKKAINLYAAGGLENDKKTLTHIVQQAKASNRDTECRVNSVVRNPQFKMTFIHKSEAFMKDSKAEYNHFTNEAKFTMNMESNDFNKRRFLHEVGGHAFVASQSRNKLAVPYETPEQKKTFVNSFDVSIKRIKNLLSLFSKSYSSLTKEEKNSLDRIKKAAKGFKAMHHPTEKVSKNELSKVIKDKEKFKKDTIMLSPLKISEGEIPLYHHGYKKITDETYDGIVSVDDGVSDKGKIALLEMYWLLAVHVPGNNYPTDGERHAEMDAFAQELIQSYPGIFDPIFPELKEYHFDRGDEHYKNCIRHKN